MVSGGRGIVVVGVVVEPVVALLLLASSLSSLWWWMMLMLIDIDAFEVVMKSCDNPEQRCGAAAAAEFRASIQLGWCM